eukprot:13088154-Heterocapsa_arctica.AAC.1
MEVQPFLEPGRHRTEDRTHRRFPGNQTSAEKQIEQIWRSQIVKTRSEEHHPDEQEGIQLICDRGCEE